jgi:hypothetical protein
MERATDAVAPDAATFMARGRNVTLYYGGYPRPSGSGLGRWRGQLVGLNDALEGGALVRTVAKWLAFGEAAAAEADLGASAQTVGVAFLVNHFDLTVNQKRAVIHNCNFYVWHSILRSRLASFWPRGARRGRMVVGAGQYFGTEGSTSSDQARIPPFRFRILRKPARCRNSTASAERLPLRQ